MDHKVVPRGPESELKKKHQFFLRISHYAMTSTAESVYVLGGYTGITNEYSSIIAEFKDDRWIYAGDMAQGKQQHDAITSGPYTMIVGGNPSVSQGSS